MGNNTDSAQFQGWTIPILEDDLMSCDSTDGQILGTQWEAFHSADSLIEPTDLGQPQWVCRDASGSEADFHALLSLCLSLLT